MSKGWTHFWNVHIITLVPVFLYCLLGGMWLFHPSFKKKVPMSLALLKNCSCKCFWIKDLQRRDNLPLHNHRLLHVRGNISINRSRDLSYSWKVSWQYYCFLNDYCQGKCIISLCFVNQCLQGCFTVINNDCIIPKDKIIIIPVTRTSKTSDTPTSVIIPCLSIKDWT